MTPRGSGDHQPDRRRAVPAQAHGEQAERGRRRAGCRARGRRRPRRGRHRGRRGRRRAARAVPGGSTGGVDHRGVGAVDGQSRAQAHERRDLLGGVVAVGLRRTRSRKALRVRTYSCGADRLAARGWRAPSRSGRSARSPARRPARRGSRRGSASPTPVGSTRSTSPAIGTWIGSSPLVRMSAPSLPRVMTRVVTRSSISAWLQPVFGLGEVRLVLVGEQVVGAVDQLADERAVGEGQLLRRVGDERDAAAAALVGVAEHRLGVVGADEHEVEASTARAIGPSSIIRASAIAPA